jgi:hypothetical protein
MMSMGSTHVVALALALVLALCDASDRSSLFHNQIDADPPSVDVSDRLLSLPLSLEVGGFETFDSCPVCDTDKLDVLDRFVKSTLFKYKRLIRNSSSFTRFRRALRRPLIRRHYNKRVSAETITPILQDTASHFSALADTARVTQKSIPDSDSLTDVYAILAEVATSSALFVTEVSSILQNNDATAAGIVATSVLSILGFFERFTLATISTITYFATAEIVVPENSVQGNVDIFSVDALDDVLSDVMTFLSARGDTSGLISVIGSATANISNLKDRLLQLHSQADAVSQSKSTTDAGSDATMQFEAYAEVVSLMDGMSFTVLSSAIGLAVAIPPVIGRIATHTVGLFHKRITTLVTLVNSTSSSSHEMFDGEAKGSFVSGDTLFYRWCIKKFPPKDDEECESPFICLQISPCVYPLLILTSPIWLPALLVFVLIYRINNPPVRPPPVSPPASASWNQVQCHMDALSCQNDALAASLPSL